MASNLLRLLTQALFFASSVAYTARASPVTHSSQEPEEITPQLFSMFQMYANFAAASYSDCGQTPEGAEFVDFVNVNRTTTQAVLFRNDAEKEIVIAFPGTVGPVDSKLDFEQSKVPFETLGLKSKDCEWCHVHHGFLDAWNSIAHPASKAVRSAMADYPDYKLAITGHSLGAAIASLATVSMKSQGFHVKRTVTFGEPRVGGPRYAYYMDKIMGASETKAGDYHRVTHANDGVPQAPSQSEGYRHSRTEYWERGLKTTEDSTDTFRCFGQEPSNCNDSTDPSSLTDAAHGYYAGVVMSADSC